MIAAERAGIPLVVVNVIASGALVRTEHVAAPLARLREANGLPWRSDVLDMLAGDLVISPFPPCLRDPAFPLPPDAVSLRHEGADDTVGHPAADWLADAGEGSRIYLTLGTIFNKESGDVFARALEGLQQLPARVLATIGHDIDPSSIPIHADNLRIEPYVPQTAALAHADLVVNHAGSGSVIGALAHALPLLTIPMGADQELNAARLTALGAGVSVDAVSFTPADIRAAASDVLCSQPTRSAAQRIRQAIEALPVAASVVPRLEQLISEHPAASVP
jgi:UDP:flavonoid glycosyltransferase YjiC (YdhE family)